MYLLKQRGVGLIEVLVTILVIAVGLLGLVGMQMASMKNINNAHDRSLATIAAYDMAERMRSNPAAVKAGDYDNLNGTETSASCCGASFDAFEWGKSLKASFPDGATGTVTAVGGFHDIKISWKELTADNDKSLNDPDFTLRVKIYVP